MDLLTRKAEFTRILLAHGARFEVRGTPRVLSAINAMVPAHAPFLVDETGWSVVSEVMADGVALVVGGDAEQIQSLGFFGLMTIGAHHQDASSDDCEMRQAASSNTRLRFICAPQQPGSAAMVTHQHPGSEVHTESDVDTRAAELFVKRLRDDAIRAAPRIIIGKESSWPIVSP